MKIAKKHAKSHTKSSKLVNKHHGEKLLTTKKEKSRAMEFFQGINLFYYVILFCGLAMIFDGFKGYWQQGVSAESSMARLWSLLLSAAITGFVSLAFNEAEGFYEPLIFLAIPLAFPLIVFFKKLKHIEVNVKKYSPSDFFSIIENNLEKNGYEYIKRHKEEDALISSKVITYYEIPKTKEEFKVEWKDLDQSNIIIVFESFYDKDVIKEIMQDLKERKSNVSFFQQTKYQWLFGIAFIWFSFMKLIGY